jgi:hypothetical protein
MFAMAPLVPMLTPALTLTLSASQGSFLLGELVQDLNELVSAMGAGGGADAESSPDDGSALSEREQEHEHEPDHELVMLVEEQRASEDDDERTTTAGTSVRPPAPGPQLWGGHRSAE